MGFLSSLFQSGAPAPQVAGPPVATTSIPKELAPYYKDILGKAQALYNEKTAEGYKPYTGPTMADFTPEQQQAFTGIAGLQGQQAPIFDEAMQMTRTAATPMTQEQLTTYMSPYQQAVTDIEKREATKLYQTNVVPQLAAKAAMTQPFGGSRQAILEGMAADTQQRLLSDIQAKGSAQAYQDAVSRFNEDRLAQGQGGAQLAQMAPAQYKAQLGEYGALQTIGEEKQKQSQTALDEAFRQYTLEQNYPYDTMSKYQATVTGAPLGKTEFAKPAPATPSLGQQLISGLGGLGNLYGSFTGKTIGGQPYVQAEHGGGLSTLIKRKTNGPLKTDFEIDETKFAPKSAGGFNIIRNADGSINAMATQNQGIETYLKEDALFRKAREETKRLGKVDLDKAKNYLAADKANAQFNREQALFSSMAAMGTDQDVSNVQGVGQVLTMLGKVGPQVGKVEAEQKANIREQDQAVSKLELQYQQALSAGDLEAANGFLEMINKVINTQSTATSSIPTTTYKVGMNTGDFNELAEKMFPGSLDQNNNWVMPDQYIEQYTNLMTQFTKATAKLDTNPSTSFTVGGKTFEIDIARDLIGGGRYPPGSVTFRSLATEQSPEIANVYKSALLYFIRDKQKGGKQTFNEKVSAINAIDPPGPNLNEFEKTWTNE